MAKPIVAITMGDPAGIGPEVVLKALARPEVRKACHPLVVGDWEVLKRLRLGKGHYPRLVLWKKGETIESENSVPVYSLSCLSSRQWRSGHPSKACGEVTYRYICAASELALSGAVDGIATAPISKQTLRLAGYPYPGHTELLAELAGVRECWMMLTADKFRVVTVTGHLAWLDVPNKLSKERVRVTVERTYQALRDYFRIMRPRIAVAALNPHAGEEEIFGSEEKRVIAPAVRESSAQGIKAEGPFPADSLFSPLSRKRYDAFVCMYHDQGLIPFKTLHFLSGAVLTLGLPFVRTSVDHGTAYDIAGKHKADPSSMKEAILLAARLARQNLKERQKR